MSTKALAVLFGIVFIAVGILGYVPAAVIDGKLLGLFMIDSVHNMVHLASGVFALAAAWTGYGKLYFKVFGVIYALVAIAGFALNGNLYIMHMNMADNILHTVIAVAALAIGYCCCKSADAA